MTKIGFICEGRTEQILLQSNAFGKLLASFNLEPLPVIDGDGIRVSGRSGSHRLSQCAVFFEKTNRIKQKQLILHGQWHRSCIYSGNLSKNV